MTSNLVIDVTSLTKSFGRFRALTDIDLEVRAGEVHGFLGPNGAGKSTTIRVLLGLLRADGGSARVLGGDPWRDAVALHRRLAYVPGDVSVWPSMSGGEAIDLLGALRGGLNESRRKDLVERFELDPTKRGRQFRAFATSSTNTSSKTRSPTSPRMTCCCRSCSTSRRRICTRIR